MSTTFSVPFAARGTSEPIELTIIPASEFNAGVANAEGTETLYKHLEGSPNLPTTVRVGTYPVGKNSNTSNRSAKLSTTGVKTDGDGVETTFPMVYTIAEADGSQGQLSAADRAALLLMAVSIFCRGAGLDDEPSTNVLSRLTYGESDVLHVTHS